MSTLAARCAPGAPPAVSFLMVRAETNVRRVPLLSFALLATLAACPLVAGSVSAPMTVSCTVLARAVMTVTSQPAYVTVTKADIARGYVDIVDPIVVHVRTNSRAGYLLQADQQSVGLGTIELGFSNSGLTVGDNESWISRPYVAGGDVIAMHARIHLGAATQPGSYPLPLSLSVRPL